jgi:peptide deformylase
MQPGVRNTSQKMILALSKHLSMRIVKQSDKNWDDDEGCLSIPSLSRSVSRPWSITVEYFDRAFIKQTRTFAGATARMIQHEI